MKRACFTLIELLVVIAIIAILAAMLLPALNKARETAKKGSCLANTKQMMIGCLSYADTNAGFYPSLNNAGNFGFAGWKWQISEYLNVKVVDNRVTSSTLANNEKKLAQGPFMCPSWRADQPVYAPKPVFGGGYGFNWYGVDGSTGDAIRHCNGIGYIRFYNKTHMIKHPTMTIAIGDSHDTTDPTQGAALYKPDMAAFGVERHYENMNVGFADGHSGSLSLPELKMKRSGVFLYYYSKDR